MTIMDSQMHNWITSSWYKEWEQMASINGNEYSPYRWICYYDFDKNEHIYEYVDINKYGR